MADCISARRTKSRLRGAGGLAVLALATCVFGAGQSRTASAAKAVAKKSAPEDGAESAKVTAIRYWSLSDVTRVAVEVSSEFRFKLDHLPDPERLFFDIPGAKPALPDEGPHNMIRVGDPLLKQIRIAETQPGVTRIVLDLEQPATQTTSQLSNPNRLIIELRARDSKPTSQPAPATVSANRESAPVPAAEDADAAPPPRPVRRPFVPPAHISSESSAPPAKPIIASLPPLLASVKEPILYANIRREFLPPPADLAVKDSVAAKTAAAKVPRPAFPGVPESAEPLPAKRNAEGDRSLTRVLGLKLGRVVLDPGHGGYDMGTHGPSGLTEKDLVLDVARRLGALIEDRMGSEVIYTRSDDTFIPLEERTAIANQHKADLFLSIHANSSPYRSAAGVETYILNFTTSKTALDLAARENASSERSVFDLKETLNKIALKDKIDESREFASRLQTALWSISAKNNAAAKDRGVKRAPFVVLIGAQMPSVLAEIGFLTNAGDEALLRKNEQRQKIAEALYKGIASYADSLSHFQVAKRE